ncbi:MAG: putative PEP-binding protein, partial [Pseudomonadota bacterium]|nr:putative PEP-binding protein [Pseudomonadota bacterium]
LMAEVDFVSIGSNDLFQFVMASDRGNARIANRFDPLSRVFLRVLRAIVVKAEAHSMPLTLCGEIAGRPLSAMALVAIGMRSISMAPSSIGPVKSMIRQLDVGELAGILLPEIDRPARDATVRELLIEFAGKHGIQY